jgi:hypothetical protein
MNLPMDLPSLIDDHREIEAALDCLAESVAAATIDVGAFRRVYELCVRHFEREEAFLTWLGARDGALAAKLRGQHDETLELAARLEEAVLADDNADSIYLLRRFLAIAQHNMIEEERDVFPLVSPREFRVD